MTNSKLTLNQNDYDDDPTSLCATDQDFFHMRTQNSRPAMHFAWFRLTCFYDNRRRRFYMDSVCTDPSPLHRILQCSLPDTRIGNCLGRLYIHLQ